MELQQREKSNDEAMHYLWGAFNPGMLTPDSQVFHDTHSTKSMGTEILLNILEDCLLWPQVLSLRT